MKRQLRWAATALFCAVLTAAPGCNGESKIKVTGKVLKDGRPFTVARDTLVTLSFVPDIENSPHAYQARFTRATGAFELEVPPGTYRLRYVIVPKGQEPINAPPEITAKIYELTKSQELDLEIK